MLELNITDALPLFDLEVRLTVPPGELLVLYGPSGAGKSTLLGHIAGFRQPRRGQIRLAGRLLFRAGTGESRLALPLEDRRVGLVSQELHLFPHLTVAENLAYGRDATGWRELARKLEIEELLDRRPAQLSGGERQRVALGRVLAGKPDLLLLDEPFAALEGPLRYRLGRLVQELQAELGLSTILVTHSFAEAARLGHRLAVMDAGRLRQVDTLPEILRQPADRRVAELVGYLNFLPVRQEAGVWTVAEPAELLLAISPRDWRLQPPAGEHLAWSARVRAAAPAPGGYRTWLLDSAGRELTVDGSGPVGQPGREITLYVGAADWHRLNPNDS